MKVRQRAWGGRGCCSELGMLPALPGKVESPRTQASEERCSSSASDPITQVGLWSALTPHCIRQAARQATRKVCTAEAPNQDSPAFLANLGVASGFMGNLLKDMDTLPEWSKGVDSSSTSASCVGSNPTGVISH